MRPDRIGIESAVIIMRRDTSRTCLSNIMTPKWIIWSLAVVLVGYLAPHLIFKSSATHWYATFKTDNAGCGMAHEHTMSTHNSNRAFTENNMVIPAELHNSKPPYIVPYMHMPA